MSDGWNANAPRLNQLCAPLNARPIIKRKASKLEKKRKIGTRTFVCFKKRKSIKEKTKKIVNETDIQISWCTKKDDPMEGVSADEKDFIVIRPAPSMGRIKTNKIQSILRRTASDINIKNLF